MTEPDFTASKLRAAFRDLSGELVARGVRGHVYVVGGAAIALGFDARRHTADVDAVIEAGWEAMEEAVRAVGRRRGWPDWWLNEDVAALVPVDADLGARVAYEDPGLLVMTASAERLLAMKLRAAREEDRRDIALLVRHLGLSCGRDAFDAHDEVFPHDPPRRSSFERARRILRDLWPGDRSLDRDDRYGYRSGRGRAGGGRSQ